MINSRPDRPRRVASSPMALTLVLVLRAVSAAHAQGHFATNEGAGVQAQTAPTQTAPTHLPFPNRANELMPLWLRIRGEFRERVEGVTGSGFSSGRNDAYWLTRLRLNATIKANSWLSLQAQAQDARVADKEIGATSAPFRGALDLRLAFADLGAATSRVVTRVGRQELVFGDQRLVGHVSWLNTARTFDGVHSTIKSKPIQLDVFATSLVRSLDGQFDKSGNGNRFVGAYATMGTLLPKATVEPYMFVKSDRDIATEVGGLARLTSTTAGIRIAGVLPARLDYIVEMAGQAGAVGADSIRAWAGHWRLRETLPGNRPARIFGEFNAASGDADPTDGRRGTFDQLYPTGHDKYGLADQVGWRNVRHLNAGVELPAVWKTQVGAAYHTWWLMESRDALYSAGGAVLARVASGASSMHVGHEIDVQATRALTPQLLLGGGYAYIVPGGFLKEATPGASYSAPFVMLTYVFLADR